MALAWLVRGLREVRGAAGAGGRVAEGFAADEELDDELELTSIEGNAVSAFDSGSGPCGMTNAWRQYGHARLFPAISLLIFSERSQLGHSYLKYIRAPRRRSSF